ncbi:MAG: hypothetical protein WDA22_14040 [Bacteroidota bacterium]
MNPDATLSEGDWAVGIEHSIRFTVIILYYAALQTTGLRRAK